MFATELSVWQKLLLFSDKLWSSKLLSSLFAAGLRLLFFRLFGAGRIRPECLQRIGCATSSSVVCPYLTCPARSKMIGKKQCQNTKKGPKPAAKPEQNQGQKVEQKTGEIWSLHVFSCTSRAGCIPVRGMHACVAADRRLFLLKICRRDVCGSKYAAEKTARAPPEHAQKTNAPNPN